ncbi:MAG: HEAT repeat domain-containing protein [Ignavibacteria bacterium]|nr:HEAT repeat domain-containing protein [Ignavibacteria bacterium]
MKPIVLLVLFIPLYTLLAQDSELRKQEQQLEDILRIQDRRTSHDIKLFGFLSDRDPIVRERTALAYGSIQDTAALPLLVDRLSDPMPEVQWNAAFAIGQTAGQLSKGGREKFEHDLIWNRLENMSSTALDKTHGKERNLGSPADRLIEEIGKFGSEQALNDLVGKFGNQYPLVHQEALLMSIARFAIRSITTPEGVEYLLRFAKDATTAPWQAIYALQRVGNHPDVRSNLDYITKLYKHPDPLVRMNLATLLGKTKDELTSLEPLQKIAEFDGDWRVRVNALKALGNFNVQGKENVLRLFRRSFNDGNPYIAMTALAAFGATGVKKDSSEASKETFAMLERIAMNEGNGYLWQLQGVADTSLARLEGKDALARIDPSRASNPILQSQMIFALGLTGAPEAAPFLFVYAGSEDKRLRTAALDGLMELSWRNPENKEVLDKAYRASLAALESRDLAIVGTASSILGNQLFLNQASVPPLLKTLSSLRVPDDVEAMQEVIAALEKLKDPRAVEPLKKVLEQRDRSVVLASASALKAITGRNYMRDISLEFEPSWVDYDFQYLNSLPDTIHVKLETIRGDATMELYKNVAPFTVMSFLKLASQRGFFRGKSFHRVVPNFVVQGGDPRGDGWGGPGYSIRSEFSPLTYETGSIGMASAGKDTEGSQFFFMQSPAPHLDGRYTLFGKITSGMEVVNRILVDDHIFDIKIIQ